MKKNICGILAVLVILSIYGCGKNNKKQQEKKTLQTTNAVETELSKIKWNMEYDPKTLDPQSVSDVAGMEVVNAAFEGLTRLGKNGEVIPAAAESWDISGSIWTFRLRKNMKWSNGDAVTAEDFLLGIKRAVDPATASEYAYLTYYIKGAQAYNEKKVTDFNQVGVKVIDLQTIQFELEKPTAYFASLLSFAAYMPVNKKNYDLNKGVVSPEVLKNTYNGPWVINEWARDNKIVLTKNQNYWNKEQIKIDEISFLLIKDYNIAVEMFRNNELDITNIKGDMETEYLSSGEQKSFSDGAAYFFELNLKNKILNNKNIRKAIAYSLDRQSFVEKILKDKTKKALSIVPHDMPGKVATFRKDYGENLFVDNNVSEGKRLYEAGIKELKIKARQSLKIVCDNKASSVQFSEYLKAQLQKNLGIELIIEPLPFQMRLQRMADKDFDIMLAGWGADFNDPVTYLDLWISNGGNNHTWWSNKEFDKNIEIAQTSTVTAIRMDAMAAAEKLMIEEMPIVPICFRSKSYLEKSNVKDVVRRVIGSDIDFYWSYIEKAKE